MCSRYMLLFQIIKDDADALKEEGAPHEEGGAPHEEDKVGGVVGGFELHGAHGPHGMMHCPPSKQQAVHDQLVSTIKFHDGHSEARNGA